MAGEGEGGKGGLLVGEGSGAAPPPPLNTKTPRAPEVVGFVAGRGTLKVMTGMVSGCNQGGEGEVGGEGGGLPDGQGGGYCAGRSGAAPAFALNTKTPRTPKLGGFVWGGGLLELCQAWSCLIGLSSDKVEELCEAATKEVRRWGICASWAGGGGPYWEGSLTAPNPKTPRVLARGLWEGGAPRVMLGMVFVIGLSADKVDELREAAAK